MKYLMNIVCIIIVSTLIFIPSQASTGNFDLEYNSTQYFKEEVVNYRIYENKLENAINKMNKEYNLTLQMTEEALDEISMIADVEKETQRLDDVYTQITYTINSKEPVAEATFKSGSTEKMYYAIAYTYLINTSSSDSGTWTETSKKSDLTFKNTVYYNYYQDGTIKMIKLIAGTTNITVFYEHGLRNLVLNAYCLGASNSGVHEERNDRTIPSPIVGENYTLNTHFNYSYSAVAAYIMYGASVTYSHGESDYTVNSNISLGR